MDLSSWYKNGGHLPEEDNSVSPDRIRNFAAGGMAKAAKLMKLSGKHLDESAKSINSSAEFQQKMAGGGVAKKVKNLARLMEEGKAVGKVSDDIQGLLEATRPLTLAERKYLAEIAAKQAEDVAPKAEPVAPKVSKKKQFIENVYSKYPEHPFMKNQRVISEGSGEDQKFAQFELRPGFGKDEVEIDWISAYPQRSGMGTKAIRALQQEAQDAGIALTLSPWDKGNTPQRTLTKFYKGLGFQPVGGRSKSLMWKPELAEAAPIEAAAPSAFEQELAARKAALAEGKEKFLSPSHIKERLYHATPKDFTEFQGEGFDPTISGHATWLGYDPEYQPAAHNIRQVPDKPGYAYGSNSNMFTPGTNVMPVHVQARSPLLLDDQGMIDWAREVFAGGSKEFPHLMPKDWADAVKESGYDSIIFAPQGRPVSDHEVIMLDPKRIKSAISNEGAYDIEQGDITKAHGGAVQHFQVGGIAKAIKAIKSAKNIEKGGESLEVARNLINSGKPLSIEERRFIADIAAKQGEELAGIRPQEIAPVATKGKSKGPSPKPERAKPKSKEDISAIAERIAPQLTGEFVRGEKGTTSVAGKSRKQFDIERDLQHEMQRSREVPEAQNIDLEPYRGNVMLSLPGDTSISDYDIFSIGGEGLRAPSRQYGGPRFGLGHPEEAGWASGLVPAAGFQRRVSAASEQYGGVPVLANYMAMGPEGLNYALHFSDALLKATKPETMTAKNIDDFNRIIRSGSQKGEFPDFPGIEHPEASYLYLAENPEARKHFNSVMQLTKTTEALGLPSGLNVRHAVSEPELRDLERGMTGFSLMEMQPSVTGLKPSKHPTYSHDIPGKFIGRTDVLYPYEMTFPDTVAAIRANPKQAGSEFGTLQMLGGKQIIDNQLLDELGQYRERIKQLTGKKEGGEVHMAGGGNPGDVSGEMFSPKPLQIPSAITDAINAIRSQYAKEKKSLQKPGAASDIALRGPVAMTMGAPADILEMGANIVDYAQKKIPALRKPASVMDTEPTRAPQMGYAPRFPLSPEGEMPYGTEAAQKLMQRAGLTTGEERPLFELGATAISPLAATAAFKGAKAAAPTIAEELTTITGKYGVDPRMYAVPPEGKAGKIKAPANEIGFYNPAEKAALNLQRKKGAGNAFVSDLKKQPGVNDERLAEIGLGDLANNPQMTKEEIIAAAEQNRIPLRETVRRDNPEADRIKFELDQARNELEYLDSDSYEYASTERLINDLERKYKQVAGEGKPLFGPEDYPDYSMPGGENYREIRVGLPSNRPSLKNMSRAEYNAAVEKADREGVRDFMHGQHHGDEPNVLFHLRVADHVDAEGKKGLLIDELQSDWHQQGREKGYAKPETKVIKGEPVQDADGSWRVNWEDGSFSGGYSEASARRVAEEGRSNARRGVPDAPFKDNWYQLGLKRAIKEAADTGMDRVYLTTGARQADRYDLSKQVSDIGYKPDGKGSGRLTAFDHNRNTVIDQSVPEDKLSDYIGKETAKKLMESDQVMGTHTLSGQDLKVGGEGMHQYYDKTYKNYLDKYAKQFGARVGETYLPKAGKGMADLTSKEIDEITSMPGFIQEMMKLSGGKTAFQMSDSQYRSIFNQVLNKFRPDLGEKVYYIDITPQMKESAAKGQSYKRGGQVKKNNGLSDWFKSGGHLPR